MFETYYDIYNSYQKFLRKKEFQHAYHCLERLLKEFPNDTQLLENMVDLTISIWGKLAIGKPWLIRLAKTRSYWLDYMLLGRIEAEQENIEKALEYMKKSRELQKAQPHIQSERNPKQLFAELESIIRYKESEASNKHFAQTLLTNLKSDKKEQTNKLKHRSPQKAHMKSNEAEHVEKKQAKRNCSSPVKGSLHPLLSCPHKDRVFE